MGSGCVGITSLDDMDREIIGGLFYESATSGAEIKPRDHLNPSSSMAECSRRKEDTCLFY